MSVIDRVEEVLKLPRPDSVDEAAWHEAAIPTLFPDDGVDSGRIMELGVEIIGQLPLERLSASLDEVSAGNGAVEDIRQIRKLLLIGRDTLILSSYNASSSRLDPIFNLSRTLGRVTDTGGRKRSSVETAHAALNDLEDLDWPELYDVSEGVLKHRCLKSLGTDFMLSRHGGMEESVFHNARKNFRRVVHLAIVACSENPSREIDRLAAEGREINVRYGSFHGRLARQKAA